MCGLNFPTIRLHACCIIIINVTEYLKKAQLTSSNAVNDIGNLKFKLIDLNSILYGLICFNWQSCVSLWRQTRSIGKIWFEIATISEVMQAMWKVDPQYKGAGFPNSSPFVLDFETLSSDTTSPSEVWNIVKRSSKSVLQFLSMLKRSLLNPEHLKLNM